MKLLSKYTLLFVIVLVQFGLSTDSQAQTINWQPFASGFSNPVIITYDNQNNLYVAENKGIIRKVSTSGVVNSTAFLNINSKVVSSYSGVHGMAFHPNYSTNGYFFIKYYKESIQTIFISRFSRNASNPDIADLNSELILLSYPGYYGHLGGNLIFGPDGYLYTTTGDGANGARGMTGDELMTGQNTRSIKGKLLRIDVTNGTLAFPPTNPHLALNDGIPDEIIAQGLRNVWRFSFDKVTGDMWLGDVGQDSYEEVDFLPAGTFENRNLGWSCLEGDYPIHSNYCNSGTDLTAPVHTYAGYNFNGHKNACVIGGYVYRGTRFTGLNGWYIFGDYNSGEVWRMKLQPEKIIEKISENFEGLVSFGESPDGDIFLISYPDGIIYKMQLACETENISGIHTANDLYLAGINLNSSKKINGNLRVEYWSAGGVLLQPGFQVDQGSVFKAQIGNCEN